MLTYVCAVSDKLPTVVPSSRPVITVTLPALNNTPPGHLQLSNTPVNTSPATLPSTSSPCENYSLDVSSEVIKYYDDLFHVAMPGTFLK